MGQAQCEKQQMGQGQSQGLCGQHAWCPRLSQDSKRISILLLALGSHREAATRGQGPGGSPIPSSRKEMKLQVSRSQAASLTHPPHVTARDN